VIALAQLAQSSMDQFGNGDVYGKKQPILVARRILGSVFRVFDENNNGSIEAIELYNIFSSWIITIMNLGTDFVAVFEDLTKSEVFRVAALEIGMSLKSISTSDSGDVIIDQTLKSLLESVPDEAPKELSESLTLRTNFAVRKLYQLIPDAESRVQSAMYKYKSLLKSFDTEAGTGRIPKDSIVQRASEVFCDVIELFLASDVISQAVDGPLAKLNLILQTNTILFEGISKELSTELIEKLVLHLRRFFREGALRQILATLFDLIDINNDSEWSKGELVNLGKALSLLTQVWSSCCSF
jgi:Ca2+-binding EF-hand superfamily protein